MIVELYASTTPQTLLLFIAAGTCITSDTYIVRDIYYNGNPIQERATVISRIAPTFIRYIEINEIYCLMTKSEKVVDLYG